MMDSTACRLLERLQAPDAGSERDGEGGAVQPQPGEGRQPGELPLIQSPAPALYPRSAHLFTACLPPVDEPFPG